MERFYVVRKIDPRSNCRRKKRVEENVSISTNAMNIVRISKIVRGTFLKTGWNNIK